MRVPFRPLLGYFNIYNYYNSQLVLKISSKYDILHTLNAHYFYGYFTFCLLSLFCSGVSMNPAVDIGQVEGCFIMGAGAFLTEEQVRQYAATSFTYFQRKYLQC